MKTKSQHFIYFGIDSISVTIDDRNSIVNIMNMFQNRAIIKDKGV